MGRIIAIANQKGGVGKTTTSINLSATLAEAGQKVLTIDIDPQGNTTSGLGIDKNDLEFTTYELMIGECDINQCLIRSEIVDNLDILPSNINLSAAEVSLVNAMSRELVLRTYMEQIRSQYDYVLIDCMPSLGILTVNAHACADSVLKRRLNNNLSIEGILFTMVDRRTVYAKEIVSEVNEVYGKSIPIFPIEIPMSVRASETSQMAKTIYDYDPKGKAASAYSELTREVLEHGC